MTASVQIGIVVYNSVDDLPRCFEGIRQQTYSPIRVTVLDNASSDDSAAWLRRHAPEAQLIASAENLGFGRGHNALMRERRAGEYYLALNPDVYLLPGYVAALVAALDADEGAGWGIGKLLLPDGERIYSIGHALLRGGFAFNIGYGLPDSAAFAQSREVFGAPGAAVLLKAALIEALNPAFDEHIFLYGEDTDLDWRARLLGWRCLYAAEAVALHRGSEPGARRRTEATANRYLSVLKNAFLSDLLFYNLPMLAAHLLFRIVTTPRLGLYMARLIISGAPASLRQRRRAAVSREAMHTWFAWARQQPTSQPRSFPARLKSFLEHRRRRLSR